MRSPQGLCRKLKECESRDLYFIFPLNIVEVLVGFSSDTNTEVIEGRDRKIDTRCSVGFT
jgi:hypothetical protein